MPSTLRLVLTVEIIWNGFTFFEWSQLIFRAIPGGNGIHQVSRRVMIQPQAFPVFATYDAEIDEVGLRVPVHLVPNRPARDQRFAHLRNHMDV